MPDKVTGEMVPVGKRGYQQSYSVAVYRPSGKVDLRVMQENYVFLNLKMTEAETEELITRLQYALFQAREVRSG